MFTSRISDASDMSYFDDLVDDDWSPQINVEDVWQMLQNLPIKSTGIDDIPMIIYKKSAIILAEPIHHLLSESLRQRRLPKLWKTASVIPVPKSKSVNPEYRPISLLPIPAKLLEKVILRDLRPHLSACLGESQFGVRKNSSTTHAIIVAHETLTKQADDIRIGASVFISFDFSKAFDRICHLDLLNIVKSYNLPSGFLLLLRDYLMARQQKCKCVASPVI